MLNDCFDLLLKCLLIISQLCGKFTKIFEKLICAKLSLTSCRKKAKKAMTGRRTLAPVMLFHEMDGFVDLKFWVVGCLLASEHFGCRV